MGQPIVSVGFCVWNEEENILNVLKEADSVLSKDFSDDFEVIVVDNCSSDDTPKVVADYISDKPNFKLIIHPENLLYSGSNNTILRESTGQFIATVDGDGQHTTKDIKKAVDFLNKTETDLLFGWKKNRNDSLFRIITSLGFRVLTKLLINNHIHDINCGFRVFRSSKSKDLKLAEKINSAGPEYFCLAKAYRLKIIEMPVDHFERSSGEGLFNNLPNFMKGVWNFVKYIVRLRAKYTGSNLKKLKTVER